MKDSFFFKLIPIYLKLKDTSWHQILQVFWIKPTSLSNRTIWFKNLMEEGGEIGRKVVLKSQEENSMWIQMMECFWPQ